MKRTHKMAINSIIEQMTNATLLFDLENGIPFFCQHEKSSIERIIVF